jgi:molybdopterin synthase catalytic subunit
LEIKVNFFALYRERAGRRQTTLDLSPGTNVSRMIDEVRHLFPDLAPPTVNIVVAVNTEYAGPDVVLHDGDDVALIPPVSGGEDMIEISHQPLKPENVTAKVRKDTNGAVVTFLGTTRLFAEGKKVLYLEYEAYEEMALREMEKIRGEICSEWSIEDIAIAHRIGRVDIGEISLVVAVASPHRKEAFYACHQAVDLLKEKVPIWKKEFFEDGYRWVACEDHEHTLVQNAP